jgi:hypothetical protein
MSITSGPEVQDALFEPNPSHLHPHPAKLENIPAHLTRATLRLQYPPTYVIVGVYRLFTDKALFVPAWKKCKHGVIRGAALGIVWVRTSSHPL